ncbi:hypothetical protein BK010_06755 [Tenericutes bacterium MO-XQ]|nr:hypothetical protein BK010_06755 [Tenericutes bacterium MO-XQ]
MNRLGTARNYKIEIKLSKKEIINIIKNNNNFHINFEENINEKVVVLFLLKEFVRILVNGIITMTVIIKEKNDQLSEVLIAMHNPVASEGLFNDLNVGASTRKDFFKELEPYIISLEEITQQNN